MVSRTLSKYEFWLFLEYWPTVSVVAFLRRWPSLTKKKGNVMKSLLAAMTVLGGLCAGAGAASASCGPVTIADMNWASAGIAAQLDKFILEKGYGCTVTLVPGDTVPTLATMRDKAEPDIAPEMWNNTIRTPLAAALTSGALIQTTQILSEGGVEGWWIPKYMADEHRDIRTVQDALKHPDLFPAPLAPEKGAIYNCPPQWGCSVTTANLFRAFKAEEAGFQLIETLSVAGLEASINNATDRKIGWLGYYWAPNSLLGRHQMVRLSFGADVDEDAWNSCISVAGCPDPQVSSYPVTEVYTVVTRQLAEREPELRDYLSARTWDNATLNQVMAWMEENRRTEADAAQHFLQTYPDVWAKWVPGDVAAAIKAAL